MSAPGDCVPDIWAVRDAIDDFIRTYRDVRDNGGGNAQVQAPVAIGALQGLRIELFGDVLAT